MCKFYSLDEHTRLPDILMISTRVWKGLTAEQQQILQQAADESVVKERELWAQAVQDDLETAENKNVTIIRPDKQPFRDIVRPIWDKFLGSDDPQDTEIGDLIKRIQEVR